MERSSDILSGATAINALPDVRWLIETHSSDLESECATRLALAGFKTQIVRNCMVAFHCAGTASLARTIDGLWPGNSDLAILGTSILLIVLLMDRRILYVQFTDPAAYPPIEHSAVLLAERGWDVILLGTGTLGDLKLELPAHPRVRVRKMGFVRRRLETKTELYRVFPLDSLLDFALEATMDLCVRPPCCAGGVAAAETHQSTRRLS